MSECISEPVNLAFWQRPLVRPNRLVIVRADRVRIALFFASLFAFLGVIGKLFTPGSHHYRAFYFVFPIGLLTLSLLATKATWKALLICVPLTAYIIFSGATAVLVVKQSHTGNPTALRYAANASSATLAALMVVNQFLFVIVTATHIKNASSRAKVRLVELFLLGYLVTLCFGYVFMIGGATGALSYPNFIHKFTFTQDLHDKRFQPGSDANEYGIMSSFALTTMLYYWYSGVGRHLPQTWLTNLLANRWTLIMSVPLTFMAILLTSTRAAIIAFAGGVVWILFRAIVPQFRRLRIPRNSVPYVLCTVVAVTAVFAPIAIYDMDHLKFLYQKFADAAEGDGTAENRLVSWKEAFDRFFDSPLLGFGYHTHEYLHNTWLQAICDLGILGVALLVATGAILIAVFHFGSIGRGRNLPIPADDRFLSCVTEVAVVTVLWFAATNHNFDYFLTWFAVLLVLIVGSESQSLNSRIGKIGDESS